MSAKIMSLVYQRSGGLCEASITSRCTGRGEHKHHRKLRSRGGVDSTSCLVDICHQCHDWIHAHPKDATERGWMVPSWAEPAEVPVYRYRQWVLLDDEGGLSPGGGGRVNTELVAALTKALADAQRELESERARSEQLVLRLHQAGRREQQYIEVIAEQNELIALLEGRDLGVRNVA